MRPEHELLTLQDWHEAYRGGASVNSLVGGRALRVERESPARAWITVSAFTGTTSPAPVQPDQSTDNKRHCAQRAVR